jgi:Ca2+-binding RTX toxin-like protein
VFGNDGDDGVYGGGGNDIVEGNDGADDAFGDAGSDLVLGGTRKAGARDVGHDDVYGGTGLDLLIGDNGNRTVQPNVRPDQPGMSGIVAYDLDGTDTNAGDDDMISGGDGVDVALGGLDIDVIYGNAADDHLHGNNAGDFVYGTTAKTRSSVAAPRRPRPDPGSDARTAATRSAAAPRRT